MKLRLPTVTLFYLGGIVAIWFFGPKTVCTDKLRYFSVPLTKNFDERLITTVVKAKPL